MKLKWQKWNEASYDLDEYIPGLCSLGIHCSVRRYGENGPNYWIISSVVLGDRCASPYATEGKTYTTAQKAMRDAELKIAEMTLDHIENAHKWVVSIVGNKPCQKAAKNLSKKKNKLKRKSKN